jgi:hypothetical protein
MKSSEHFKLNQKDNLFNHYSNITFQNSHYFNKAFSDFPPLNFRLFYYEFYVYLGLEYPLLNL